VALTEMAPASIFRCGGPGDVEGGDETAQDEEAGRGEGAGEAEEERGGGRDGRCERAGACGKAGFGQVADEEDEGAETATGRGGGLPKKARR
jgi:hypothetical protein